MGLLELEYDFQYMQHTIDILAQILAFPSDAKNNKLVNDWIET